MLNHDKWGKFIHKRNFPDKGAMKLWADFIANYEDKPITVVQGMYFYRFKKSKLDDLDKLETLAKKISIRLFVNNAERLGNTKFKFEFKQIDNDRRDNMCHLIIEFLKP